MSFMNKKDKNDIRTLFAEQLKTLDLKVDLDTNIIAELQDFYKRRAEIENNYSEQLNGLVKAVKSRHTLDAKKKDYVCGNIWHLLVACTAEVAREHKNLAEVYDKQMTQRLSDIQDDCVRLLKQTREAMDVCQRRIVESMNILNNTANAYADQMSKLAQTHKSLIKAKKTWENSEKKREGKRVTKTKEEFDLKYRIFEETQSETAKARNNYLLQLCECNASLRYYHEEEVPDLIECLMMGYHNNVARSLMMHISCEESIGTVHHSICHLLSESVIPLDMARDKTTLLDKNPCLRTYVPLEFQQHKDDEVSTISADQAITILMKADEATLKAQNDTRKLDISENYKTLCETETRLIELINQQDYNIQILVDAGSGGSGGGDNQTGGEICSMPTSSSAFKAATLSRLSASANSVTESPTDLSTKKSMNVTGACYNLEVYSICRSSSRDKRIQLEKYYIMKFIEYLALKDRFQVTSCRIKAIQEALKKCSLQNLALIAANVASRRHQNSQTSQSIESLNDLLNEAQDKVTNIPAMTKPNRQAEIVKSAPKLFNGTIDEYLKFWHVNVPEVVEECVEFIKRYGMDVEGIFRVPGSHNEVNNLRDKFEKRERVSDFLTSYTDINNVAGLLKLYFRTLAKSPISSDVFDEIKPIFKMESEDERIDAFRNLFRTRLSKYVFNTLRFLFAFLKELSEHSDKNMMDANNLGICFGPSLIAFPDDSVDVSQNQSYATVTVRTIILHHERIFDGKDLSSSSWAMKQQQQQHPTTTTTSSMSQSTSSLISSGSTDVISTASLLPTVAVHASKSISDEQQSPPATNKESAISISHSNNYKILSKSVDHHHDSVDVFNSTDLLTKRLAGSTAAAAAASAGAAGAGAAGVGGHDSQGSTSDNSNISSSTLSTITTTLTTTKRRDEDSDIDSGVDRLRSQLNSIRQIRNRQVQSVVLDNYKLKLPHLPVMKNRPDLMSSNLISTSSSLPGTCIISNNNNNNSAV